jgi:hypothetical protein
MMKVKTWMPSPSFPLYGTGLACPRRRVKAGAMIKINTWLSSLSFPLYGTGLACPRRRIKPARVV